MAEVEEHETLACSFSAGHSISSSLALPRFFTLLLAGYLRMNVHFNMPLLQHFLRTSHCSDGDSLLRKACVDGEPGAVQLLVFATKIRSNRRTRRSVEQVMAALDKAERPRQG